MFALAGHYQQSGTCCKTDHNRMRNKVDQGPETHQPHADLTEADHQGKGKGQLDIFWTAGGCVQA